MSKFDPYHFQLCRTAVGVRCTDGVVLGVEKLRVSRLLVKGSDRRCFAIDRHVGLVVTGLAGDARSIVLYAQRIASNHRKNWGEPVPPKMLAEQLADVVYAYTTSGGYRPFGAQVLIAGYDAEKAAAGEEGADGTAPGWELYMVEVDGTYHRFFGVAIGKGARTCKTEIEKAKLWSKSSEEALTDVSRMLHTVHDDSKEKPMEVEMAWIKLGEDGKPGSFSMVPPESLAHAVAEGRRLAEAASGGGEGDAAMEADEEEDIDG